jgi:hypothetical protein
MDVRVTEGSRSRGTYGPSPRILGIRAGVPQELIPLFPTPALFFCYRTQ